MHFMYGTKSELLPLMSLLAFPISVAHYKINLIALETKPDVTLKRQNRKHLRGRICVCIADRIQQCST